MTNDAIINWLLEGDVSIQYQTYRDLLDEERSDLQQRIAREGWGAKLLEKRQPTGHWGRGFYQPKWTSSHYTLLELRHLEITPDHAPIRETIRMILEQEKEEDGAVNPSVTVRQSDVCINGMFLNYACYFHTDPKPLQSIVDFLLKEHMEDGGFNCQSNRGGAHHSSLHSTISVLEGIASYDQNDYEYRLRELLLAGAKAREFILMHQLYKSDKTGKTIKPEFLRLPYPSRWKYDILRALDYFRSQNIPWDDRMQSAIDVLLKKRRKDGRWPLQAHHPGHTHFDMEKVGGPSRWNTLRVMRVLKFYNVTT